MSRGKVDLATKGVRIGWWFVLCVLGKAIKVEKMGGDKRGIVNNEIWKMPVA